MDKIEDSGSTQESGRQEKGRLDALPRPSMRPTEKTPAMMMSFGSSSRANA
jgi:hypothetical protein